MKEAIVRSRIDVSKKIEAEAILSALGLSTSDAIRLFINQIIMEKGLPFKVKLSDEASEAHDEWFRQQVEEAVRKADDPKTVFTPHDEVMKRFANKKEVVHSEKKREAT
jgi:addiction module RelB/DinJ family antitoxin